MKHSLIILFISILPISCQAEVTETFKDKQQRYPRVRTAMLEKDTSLRKRFGDRGLIYPPKKLFIRVFKLEKVVEVWTLSDSDDIFKKVTEYPICRTSGSLGPKRQEGDLQIPEGFYFIDRFNPKSNFYLSLGINYPNRSDVILGEKNDLGGDIFLHGGCATVGCIPITDDYIKEVYWLAVQAKSNGQTKIAVHIFPSKLDRSAISQLRKTYDAESTLVRFWKNLEEGYLWFEKHRMLPKTTVNSEGKYQFSTPTSQ